ncbi:ABC transporter substrate-binding protein [Mesorhizobium sp. WSM4307]|uniref:ABC transporter substrate-binding protein n=1 Tax=unclassified Mesorhizobium TaxID=325217 RepID=UPI000BAF96A9|nr:MULTISPECIES: ABC transporter substrate-binding protein [unclassified Mesorhizobium]PBB24493.1 peptide ABC transporter substrate-binding protein [Mesorhizobium sp. WSM4304]PBB74539.1 peptide ABC transporter substrate-binding protein [Mesorhizobium sp. WSM4308]TRC73299.1 ABC transporter substrate-binding protein [Mesorhizobium sp. WSM4315]TRC83578.1 ABC transporter substrate-binding protein [Mesorhizobium sp. WSM4307]
MTISRRILLKAGVAAGTALSFPSILRAQNTPAIGQTVRMVKSGDLGVFDPMISSYYITAHHGAAVYDTLFSLDSQMRPQPQMVHSWGVSDDERTYTFVLRDGLSWHDGTPVTSDDCVASIRRWMEAASSGPLIKALATDISRKDEKTFIIALKEPLGLLVETLATLTPPCLFIMREKDANTPPTIPVTTNIGSGPFKFNHELARPGASFTYDRNEKYVPRREAPDGLAGGKVVKVERVIWDNIADQQTALAALQAGEIDYLESVPMDLLPVLEGDPAITLQILDKGGFVRYLRINFLQKPFNNLKARQALLHLIDQEAAMRTSSPPEYIKTVTSVFGTKTPYTNDENTGWFKKSGDPEKAKQLFQEAGYAGEKVVIVQVTNVPWMSDVSQYIANALRKIGINAELDPTEWGTVTARLDNKGSVDEGGWSIYPTSDADFAMGDVLGNPIFLANGDKAWYGWPKNDEYEALYARWATVATLEERQALAREMQRVWWDFVGSVYLGAITAPIARRASLTGLIEMPIIVPMWNMQKG